MERELIHAAKSGSPQAFSTLVRGYLPRLYAVAYGYVRNVEDASDICQETLLRVYRNFSRFDESRAFFPWVYRILKNLCLNQIQKKRPRETEYTEGIVSHHKAPDDLLLEKEEAARLREALDRLPEIHREILVLKEWGGASYRELAVSLDIPEGTVMSRLYNARRTLKKTLQEIEGEGDG
jgi:RNA polymerase sigma-70 factor (ECF subfamily)